MKILRDRHIKESLIEAEMNLIVPREKRVIVYTVLHDEIINHVQRKEYPDDFEVDHTEIQEKRSECISLTTESKNLYSFVYVHAHGKIETEINVDRPKYPFHKKYNDSL
jgi:hypothetical protein